MRRPGPSTATGQQQQQPSSSPQHRHLQLPGGPPFSPLHSVTPHSLHRTALPPHLPPPLHCHRTPPCREAAIEQLVAVACGGAYEGGLIDSFGGIRQTDAAAYIAKGVLAVATGACVAACCVLCAVCVGQWGPVAAQVMPCAGAAWGRRRL